MVDIDSTSFLQQQQPQLAIAQHADDDDDALIALKALNISPEATDHHGVNADDDASTDATSLCDDSFSATSNTVLSEQYDMESRFSIVQFDLSRNEYHSDNQRVHEDCAADWCNRSDLISFKAQRRAQIRQYILLEKRNCQGMGAFASTLKDLFQACQEDDKACMVSSPLRKKQVAELYPLQPPSRPRVGAHGWSRQPASATVNPLELIGLEKQLVLYIKNSLSGRHAYLNELVTEIQQQAAKYKSDGDETDLMEEELRRASETTSRACAQWSRVLAHAQWCIHQPEDDSSDRSGVYFGGEI
eukprot:CAMPEP_0198138672 /NCGR_PEP_ID=MMETSP1443-20131203/2068_1 /TAXON_ID=186043 /ORGANISM="Entomoneis sp., Strain CCMP2396" /LENGTH=301 /DNA_ID=CAMNT_0043800557 /DNA_START=52 /DNA_END=957 /DNA_ORIENTATION=+